MNVQGLARLSFRSEAARAAAFFAALAAVFWLSFLLEGGALFSDTLLRHVYPNFAFTRDALRASHFPFWNPHLFSGVPFSSNWQSVVFYPPTYLCLLLDFPRWLPVQVWFHTALAGWFVFRLGRLLGLSLESSGLAGILYAFNGWFMAHHTLLPHMQACAWAPGVIYYLWRARQEEEGPRPLVLGAACLAFHILSGHPQFVLYTGLLTAMVAAGGGRRAWVKAAAVWLLGLGLSAPQWLPSVPFLLMSPRAAGMAGAAAMTYSLEPREGILMLLLPQWNRFFVPDSGDPHVVGFYAGLPALALALLTLTGAGRRRWLVFAAITAAGVLLALGRHLPWAGELWGSLPLLRSFRFPAQALVMAAFGGAVLAGAGLERVAGGKWRRVVLAAVFLDLWLFARGAVEVMPAALYTASPPAARFLRAQGPDQRIMMAPHARFQSRSGGDEASAWMAFKDSLLPNLAMAEGLLDVEGYEEARFHRYDGVLNEMNSSPASPWISAFSVRYILALREVPGLKEVFRSGVRVFENPKAFPRAFVTAALPAEDPIIPAGPDGSGGAQLADEGPNRVRIRVHSRGPGFLVITDAWAPGWKARVNGLPAAIHRVNVMQRAVAVRSGPSMVEMTYEPPLLRAAAALSGFCVILGWIILRRGKKR